MTDAEFLRSMADHGLIHQHDAARLREIAADHDRMERELTRLMQEGREAHAALNGEAMSRS